MATHKTPKESGSGQTDRILREKMVIQLTGLSRSTIWREERKGNFPKRRQLSSRAVGWLESEILTWMETR